MHYHRIHPDQLEQHDVLSEGSRQLGLAHGVAPELDDHRLPAIALHVGKGFREDARRITLESCGLQRVLLSGVVSSFPSTPVW